MLKMKKFKEKLSPLHSRFYWVELILIAAWTLLMCLYISPGSFRHAIGFMLHNPLLSLLNLLPIAVLLLVLYFCCGNAFVSGGITNLIFGLLNYVNLLKVDGRDDPFVPADITLLREALQATGEYRLDMHFGIVAIMLLSTAAMIFLGVYLGKNRKHRPLTRVVGAVLCIAVFVTCFFTVYRDKELYASFPVTNPSNISGVFNELGFNYCFLYYMELYSVDKPDGYSEDAVKGYLDDFTPSVADDAKQPQVLFIMCEAFSDLNDNEVFTYSEEEHPLYGYYEVIGSDNCISGHIVVPNFGAGTANTEFDVITGMQTNLISQTSNSALRSFHKGTPSMAHTLASLGYDTLFMHPGDNWFYARDSAMSFLGFDDKLFVDELGTAATFDDGFLDALKAQLESRTANGEKLFTYATTIQNHQAYNYSKYPNVDIPKVQTSVSLSAEAEEYLSVYSYGIKCSSDMLLELTEYLNSLDEPYVLVFFGDHLPNLGPDYLSYRELGLDIGENSTSEQILDSCSVPYLIWGNDAYLDGSTMAEECASLDLPADGRISACYLGATVMELIGYGDADAFTSFLCELRRELPVIKNGIVCRATGEISNEPTAAEQELINKLHCWQYYRMISEKTS